MTKILLFLFVICSLNAQMVLSKREVVTVTYTTTTTDYKYPNSTGEDYNQWSDATSAYSSDDDGSYPNANNEQQDYYGYAFGIPAGAEILGIEASLKFVSYEGGGATSTIGIEISNNGGSTYSATSYQVSTTSTTFVTQAVGGASSLWGLTWTPTALSTTNFRARVKGLAGNDLPTLDYIAFRITYRVVN